MTLATPNGVLNTNGVVFHAPKPGFAGVAGNEPASLNVLLADGSAAELANCPRILFALDAFHMSGGKRPNAKLTDDEERAKDNRIGTCG